MSEFDEQSTRDVENDVSDLFEDSDSMMITDEEVNVETFFGASDTIYASENNLYITHMDYSYRDSKTIIYKF